MAYRVTRADRTTDPGLTEIAGLDADAGDMIVAEGEDDYTLTPSQSYGRALLNTASASALGVILSSVPVTATGSTTARTLAARYGEVANVLDYAAEADDDTSDSTAINAAIASGKKTVIVPDGEYTIGAALLMYGSDITLWAPGGNAVFKIADNISTAITLLRVRGSRCTIRGITFDGNNAAPALSGANAFLNLDTNSGTLSDFRLEDCTIQNFHGYGIFAFGAGTLTGVDIHDCAFRGFTSDAATPAGVIQLVQPTSSKIRVSSSQFTDMTGCAVSVRSVAGTVIVSEMSVVNCTFDHDSFDYTSIGVEVWEAKQLAITGNTFQNARMGLSLFGEQISVSANTFYNHTSYAIEGGRSDGLTVVGNSFGLFEYGVILYSGADDVTITGNTFRTAQATATSGTNLGWALQTSGSSLTEDYNRLMFANNICYGCSGVRLTRTVDAIISENLFETISTDNHCGVVVSGTTPINVRINDNLFRTSVDRTAFSGYVAIEGDKIFVERNSFISTTGSPNTGCAISNITSGTLNDCSIAHNYMENLANGIVLNNGPPTLARVAIGPNTYRTVTTSVVSVAGAIYYDQTNGSISDYGDVAATLSARSPRQNRWTASFTASRTITLETTDAYRGQTFRVVRTGGDTGGPWTLSVGGLKSLSQNQWCDVSYTGGAWVLIGYGTL